MKKFYKKIITFVMAVLIGINMYTFNSYAEAYVSMAVSSSKVSVGESISVTVSISGSLSAYTLYVSYDSGVLEYAGCSGSAIGNGGGGSVSLSGTGEGSTTISFTAIGNGDSYIGTSGEAFDINGDDVSISHAGVSVTVGAGNSDSTTEEKKDDENDDNKDDNKDDKTSESTETTEKEESSDCNLSSLSITPGTLEPAFSPDITEYYVHVEEDVTSMVVSAVAADDKATTAVYGAGLIEPGENSVRINVTAANGSVKVYSLRVVAGKELGEASATINNTVYRFINDASKLEKPEGYSETTAKYKDWEVLAFESPNKKLKIVALMKEKELDNPEASYEWYIINEKDESLVPYFELSAHMNKYVIINKPANIDVPEGFKEDKISIGKNVFTAYKNDAITDKNMSLVYAMNVEGEEGFYLFDSKEVTFMRFFPVIIKEEVILTATDDATPLTPTTVNKPNNNPDNSKTILLYSSICLGVLLVLMTGWLILTKISKSKMKEELRKADDMVTQLAAVNNTVNKDVLASVETIEEESKKDKKNKKNSDSSQKDKKDLDKVAVEVAASKEADQATASKKADNSSEANNSIKALNADVASVKEDVKADAASGKEDKKSTSYENMLDDDKELKDIMDMVISEVKHAGIKDDEEKKDEGYNAELDSAFIDTDNK